MYKTHDGSTGTAELFVVVPLTKYTYREVSVSFLAAHLDVGFNTNLALGS
jgi:hypothetical protein